MGGAGVEFLGEELDELEVGEREEMYSELEVVEVEEEKVEEGENTLQKSIDFTPLLPSAGPTGGLGLAWPAPTISLTTWSTAARVLDMLMGLGSEVELVRREVGAGIGNLEEKFSLVYVSLSRDCGLADGWGAVDGLKTRVGEFSCVYIC